MSRHRTELDGGRVLIWGEDRPMGTWFAQLYGPDPRDDVPDGVVGYHPDEVYVLRADKPDATVGPYPVRTRAALVDAVREHLGVEL